MNREDEIREMLKGYEALIPAAVLGFERQAPSDLRYLLEKVERLERQIDDMATDRLDCGDPMLGAIRSCPFTAITFRYNPDARELSIHASQGANRKAQRELQDRDIAAHRKASAFVAHEIIRTVEEAYAKKEPTDAT